MPANGPFIWPLGASPVPDEMNTSFGPRIDADRWDFHDGIDLPASAGTPVHAMASGVVHRAGPADRTEDGRGFGSTHVVLRVVDPTDGVDDLYLVYLHLDSIAEAVVPHAEVAIGDVIAAVGQEDATYPHLHCEFRKGGPEERRSVHPLRYLPYTNTHNIAQLRFDRCNFHGASRRAIRLGFSVNDRREGDVQRVRVNLKGPGVVTQTIRVNFDDRQTIASDKGDEHAFMNGIAVEGYQKSNLKNAGLSSLQYGVIVKDVAPEYDSVELRVADVANAHQLTAEFPLPALASQPVDRHASFEGQVFPPAGWSLDLRPGNVCRADETAALSGTRGLLCRDLESVQGSLARAALRSTVPAGRMSWRLRADIRPAELALQTGLAIFPLAFLAAGDLVAAACLRRTRDDEYVAGVAIRGTQGLYREVIDVQEGKISPNQIVRWELDLVRLGTRQTTAVLRLAHRVVARVNGDTTTIEPDAACAGILHRHGEQHVTLHFDQLVLTESPR